MRWQAFQPKPFKSKKRIMSCFVFLNCQNNQKGSVQSEAVFGWELPESRLVGQLLQHPPSVWENSLHKDCDHQQSLSWKIKYYHCVSVWRTPVQKPSPSLWGPSQAWILHLFKVALTDERMRLVSDFLQQRRDYSWAEEANLPSRKKVLAKKNKRLHINRKFNQRWFCLRQALLPLVSCCYDVISHRGYLSKCLIAKAGKSWQSSSFI